MHFPMEYWMLYLIMNKYIELIIVILFNIKKMTNYWVRRENSLLVSFITSAHALQD